MKINSNILILTILSIFIASNAILYNYLNNGYFIDKKPNTEIQPIENVIFTLIESHELVLEKRNAEILAEARRLRELKSTITDSEELRKIEEQLKKLEDDSKAILERVKKSENERLVAQKQNENDQVQLSSLLETNSKLGAELDEKNKLFDEYVYSLKDAIIENTPSSEERESIIGEFNRDYGLSYIKNLVGNIQKNKVDITQIYTQKLQSRSNLTSNTLRDISSELNNNFTPILDSDGLIDINQSRKKLLDSLAAYKESKDEDLIEQRQLLLEDFENEIAKLKEEEKLRIEAELQDLINQNLIDKEQSLSELETRLRSELVNKESIVKVDLPAPDIEIYTSWIYITGLWSWSNSQLSYSGKSVDSIAWSRADIGDNQIISFNGQFDSNGELIFILYGNGRFKSWDNGVVVTLKTLGTDRIEITISRDGTGNNSTVLYSNNLPITGTINGNYNLQIFNGKLSINLNGATILENFDLDIELNGRLGFGNREINSHEFTISNIKLFKIE